MTEKPSQPKPPRMPPIDTSPDQPVEYVNLVRIAHSAAELVFDFARLLPGDRSAQVQSRLVMSPLSAKLMFRALADNLAKYEAAYGEITVPGGSSLAESLFRPPEKPGEGE